jgi:FixJ family two-component response regulator
MASRNASRHRTAAVSRATLTIPVVDDQRGVFEEVKYALNGSSLLRFKEYNSPEEFSASRLRSVALCIIDMFFEKSMRVNDLYEIVDRKWPRTPIIILSSYPGRFAAVDRSRAVDLLSKPDFLNNGALLRNAVIVALESLNGNGNDRTLVQKVIAHLKQLDLNGAAETLTELSLGEIHYPLQRPTLVKWDGKCYTLEGLSDFIVGLGGTAAEARRSFICVLHELYHALLRTRPLYRTERQSRIWSALSSIIDMTKYDAIRSITIPYEVGQVVGSDPPGTRVIRWHRGEENIVKLEEAPELATITKGQWIRAVVNRRYLTNELTKILYVSAIEPPVYGEKERSAFWNQGNV